MEQAFHNMKDDYIGVRPIYLRREDRARAHIFVVSLSYRIVHIEEVMEGYRILKKLSLMVMRDDAFSALKLMQPDKVCKDLLTKANIEWPSMLPEVKV